MFLALPAPPSRWKQEPKKGALGLPPHPRHPRPPPPPPPPQQWTVSYRSPVTPQHFHQKTDQSLKKTSELEEHLGSFSTHGEIGIQREKIGVMVSTMASASWSKVKRCPGVMETWSL